MEQTDLQTRKTNWFPLPLRISIGYVFAAIIPLLLVLFFIWSQTRPTLIQQANNTMASDAQTRVQLIDNYFRERSLDAKTLTQVPSLQAFMALSPDAPGYQNAAVHAGYALKAGKDRSTDYINWSIFDLKGNFLQSDKDVPTKHGDRYFTPEQLKNSDPNTTAISPVYYNPNTKQATIDIDAPVYATSLTQQKPPLLGFMRATLKLDSVWKNIVAKDVNANGTGSYAFILDENNIRIADPDPNRLFTGITQLDPTVLQKMQQEHRYGTIVAPIIHTEPTISTHITNSASDKFSAQLTGQTENYQIVRQKVTVVPWQYLVLSPETSVTGAAQQQVVNILILACVAALFVAIAGIFAGIGITRPIHRAVEHLLGSSVSLSTLAESQQEAANEQIWVVDSSQVGLQSVQYYTDAAKIASEKLKNTTMQLKQYWGQMPPQQAEQAFNSILQSTQYLEHVLEYQNASNQKLATALKVATQVTEQLHIGATSATEAATQLEQVVQELRTVVGK